MDEVIKLLDGNLQYVSHEMNDGVIETTVDNPLFQESILNYFKSFLCENTIKKITKKNAIYIAKWCIFLFSDSNLNAYHY